MEDPTPKQAPKRVPKSKPAPKRVGFGATVKTESGGTKRLGEMRDLSALATACGRGQSSPCLQVA